MTETTNILTQNTKTLSLGFIGVGWIGRSRMKALLHEGHKAAMVYETYAPNAEEALELSPATVLAEHLEMIYKNPEVEGVVIATPSAMHAQQALAALEAGKAVFCQKPLARTAEEVQRLIAASEKADRLLSVDLSYRYTQAFRAVYDTVSSGGIGKIYAVNLTFHNAYGPDKDWFYDIRQSGGGCVIDLGVHLIDMALSCLDYPEITDLSAQLYHNGQPVLPEHEQVEDFAKVQMQTDTGASISLDCSWNASAGQDAVIEAVFFGTEGGAAFKNVDGSFYDFTAEKYKGTQKEILTLPPDNWPGRAGIAWAEECGKGTGFDRVTAIQYLKIAQIIDRIYGRAD